MQKILIITKNIKVYFKIILTMFHQFFYHNQTHFGPHVILPNIQNLQVQGLSHPFFALADSDGFMLMIGCK